MALMNKKNVWSSCNLFLKFILPFIRMNIDKIYKCVLRRIRKPKGALSSQEGEHSPLLGGIQPPLFKCHRFDIITE